MRTLTRIALLGGIAAASAAVVAGIVGERTYRRPQTPDDAARVLADPQAQRVSTTSGGTTLTVVRSAKVGRTVATLAQTPRLAAGRSWQLWYLDAQGRPVNAGQLPPTPAGGTATRLLDGDTRAATAVAVTSEPTGTRPSAPSEKPRYVAPLT